MLPVLFWTCQAGSHELQSRRASPWILPLQRRTVSEQAQAHLKIGILFSQTLVSYDTFCRFKVRTPARMKVIQCVVGPHMARMVHVVSTDLVPRLSPAH